MCKRAKDFKQGQAFTCDAGLWLPDCPYQEDCNWLKEQPPIGWQPDQVYATGVDYACGIYN